MEKYYGNSWKTVVELLRSDSENGLNEGNCEFIREQFGSNKINLPNVNRLSKQLFNVFKQPFIIINIIIAILLILLNQYVFAGIIGLIIVMNFVTSMVVNAKREKEIGTLEKINYENAAVIRDGMQKIIKAEDLVVGDIIKFKKNTLVPADIRIISANDLKVDEKSLTGESFVKEKFESKISGTVSSITDIKNMIFKGSIIRDGEGTGIVVGVGNTTHIGKMLTMLAYANTTKHVYDKMIFKKIGNYIIPYFIILLLFGIGIFLSNEDMSNVATGMFAVACVPAPLIGIAVFKNTIKMILEKDNIAIINFSVFELIKKANVIFLDKVGSLGKNEMIVKKIFTNNKIIIADSPENRDINFDRIMEIGMICNNAVYDPIKESGKGDLIEIALLKYMSRKITFEADIEAKNGKIFEIPVDSDKRFLTVVTRFKRRFRANSRGNIDAILERCTHIMVDGVEREITAEQKIKIKEIDMKLSMQGMVNEGFAYRNFNYEPSKSENIESNMVFVGFVALENPLEDNFEEDIRYMKDNAIVPILFTDESKLSAITNARRAGIIRSDSQVVSGIELNSLTVGELRDLIPKVRVFCRTSPEVKSQIISLFKKDGHKIVTVGETLGDIASMNFADVGISKGTASSMVKKSSDVYIEGNHLRGIFKLKDYAVSLENNIKKSFDLLNITVLTEILVLIMGQLMNKTNMLDLTSILFINGILTTLMSIAIINVNPNEREINKKGILIRSIVLSCIIGGIVYYETSGVQALVSFVIISLGTLIFNVLNNREALKSKGKEMWIYIIALIVIIIGGGIIVYFNNLVLSNINIIELVCSIIFLIIFEILLGKWQNS